MTREQFLSGIRFRYGSNDRIYKLVPGKATYSSDYGHLEEFGYRDETEYHANIKTVTKTRIQIYRTICGKIIYQWRYFADMHPVDDVKTN